MPLSPGTRLGDYEILAPLGAGGMGEVYRAHDANLARDVAVKVLPESLADHPERLRRFEKEARAAAALNHPNIVTVYSFGTSEQGTPYVVTELLLGQTIRERLLQGPIPVRKVIEYALPIALGLAAAHDRGIVHRDLKPENIFLTRDGQVKILDFGLAKLMHPEPEDLPNAATAGGTEPGIVLGTVGYMSPEQVRAQKLDHRSDIFSLGTILYEMLCGTRAFQGATSADTMSAILKEEPGELGTLVRDIPPALSRIVARCLEKNPTDRFQSARDLAFALELLSRHDSGSAASLPAPVEPKTLHRRWPAALLAIAALATGLTGGYAFLRWHASASPVELRRLTDFAGMEEFPSLSPDGKSIAFTADQGGKRQIWVRLLAGGSPLQITKDDADHQSPRWTADSASLVYFTPSRDASGMGQVWEIPALGGAARPLLQALTAADVSHDGRSIAYLRSSEGKVEIVVSPADLSSARVIAKLPPDFLYSNLRWSPDDRSLAYQSGRTFDYDVFYVPSSGGEPVRITQDGNPLGGFSWLPDNSGVVYASSRGETLLYLPTMNLWSVQIGGKNLRQLTFGETSYQSPDVGPDGRIATTRLRIQFDIWKFPTDGAPKDNVLHATPVTHQTGNVQTPSLSPADREMVYLSDSGGHGNLWVMDLSTGQSRQVTFEHDPQVIVGVPSWSPDGKYIAYARRGHSGWNVDQWVINPDGTGGHRVSEGGGWATWSTDGHWLYVAPPNASGFFIEKMLPDGSSVTKLRDEGQKPAVGPDGTLYYVMNRASASGVSDMDIYAARPETAEGKFLVRIPGSRLASWVVMQPALSPDGKSLAVLLPDGPVTNVWLQGVDGSPMRQVTDFGGQATFIARRVAWSGDGRHIFAAVGKGESDIVLAGNLLH